MKITVSERGDLPDMWWVTDDATVNTMPAWRGEVSGFDYTMTWFATEQLGVQPTAEQRLERVRHILTSGYGSILDAQDDLRAAVGLPPLPSRRAARGFRP